MPLAPQNTKQKVNRVLVDARDLFLGNSSDLRQKECGCGRLQCQNVACGGGNGEAGVGMFRVRTSVFHRNRRGTWNDGKGGPLPTWEGRGAQRNGPRRRGSRLSVLSANPSGTPIGPRHPEISGGLRRLQRRVHRHLGAFWAVFCQKSGATSHQNIPMQLQSCMPKGKLLMKRHGRQLVHSAQLCDQ